MAADWGSLWYQYGISLEGLKDAAMRFKGEVILRVSFMKAILCDIGGVLIDVDYRPAIAIFSEPRIQFGKCHKTGMIPL
jgi:hypothetical protein